MPINLGNSLISYALTQLKDAVETLQSAPPGNINIKQTEVDFGTTPASSSIFTINDADVTTNSQLLALCAYEAPTGKDLDELEMDKLDIKVSSGDGQFTLYIQSFDGSYLADKFKINYLIG